jgi:hypothetical protein
MPSGYSGKPLDQKLGLTSSQAAYLVNAPAEYDDWIAPTVPRVTTPAEHNVDFIHAFCSTKQEVAELFAELKDTLAYTGMLWVSWPKPKAGIPTDLNENIIRDIGLAAGLVDVKVCSVSEEWSGLKFVYRLKDRTV